MRRCSFYSGMASLGSVSFYS
ncbi:hypothetical protein A2U01_0102408, partial [Trifolium medium]|nr:hypothetical protein [Trifolium medium]